MTRIPQDTDADGDDFAAVLPSSGGLAAMALAGVIVQPAPA
jgi:hypothetical protein